MFDPFAFEPPSAEFARAVKVSILKSIFIKKEFTIPDIAQATNFSVTTVAKHVAELQEKNLLELVDRVKTNKRGRRPALYRVKSEACSFLGVDIKSHGLAIGLMDLSGEMVRMEQISDFYFENTHNKLDEICNHIQRFIVRAETELPGKVVCANFNIGGRVNSRTGTSASVFNFEETRDMPLTDLLSERLKIPVFIENDTKAMAYGEYASKERSGYENVIYVNVGWGLGLCLIVNGEIYYGKDGYSGEFGHVHMYNNNIMCHCGKKGCIETELSGSAICRKLIERIHNHEASVLSRKVWGGNVITIADIIAAAEPGGSAVHRTRLAGRQRAGSPAGRTHQSAESRLYRHRRKDRRGGALLLPAACDAGHSQIFAPADEPASFDPAFAAGAACRNRRGLHAGAQTVGLGPAVGHGIDARKRCRYASALYCEGDMPVRRLK